MGTYDWGVQARIAGVVSINGMLDALNSSRYNVAGPTSFVVLCENGDPLVAIGGVSANGDGWCEYTGGVSAFPPRTGWPGTSAG